MWRLARCVTILTMTISELHALAVQTDEQLAVVWAEIASVSMHRDWSIDELRRLTGQERRNQKWSGSVEEALAAVAPVQSWDQHAFDAARSKYTSYEARLNELGEEERRLEGVYRANGGWSRFFIVKNSNGHIHSSMQCHTCFPDTLFGWLPQLSGLDEAAAVADQGEILCSVCFPSAPVAWTTGESHEAKAAKAERAAAKASREAKRLEKALMLDGSTLRVRRRSDARYEERLETLHAAKVFLTEAFEYENYEHMAYDQAAIDEVANAISAKTGESVASVIAAARARAAKRAR